MEIEQETNGKDSLLLANGVRLRNTQKGYTWDITMVGFDIEKLKKLDKQLKEEWGSVSE